MFLRYILVIWYICSLLLLSLSILFLCPLHGSQPCPDEGACITQWNYEPRHAGTPETDGLQWRVLTKHGPLEEEMATHSSILAWRTPWTTQKGKKIWHQKMSPPGKVSNMLLGKSRGQLLIAPERMKWLDENGNAAQLWMYLVMDVSGGKSKVRCCKEQYCKGIWNVRSMNQGKLDMVKQEIARLNTDIFRNQWTIMKAECQRIDAFELWFWRRSPWTARRSN